MLRIFVAFNVFWYFSNAYAYAWGSWGLPLKPVHWYIFTIALSPLLLLVYRQPLIPTGRAAGVVAWACALIMWEMFSFVFVSDAGPEALQALITSSEALLLLIVFVPLLRDPSALRAATYALVLVAVCSVLINYFDFFTRGTILPLSVVPGRAAGMYLDPNTSGYSLAFVMVLSAWILPRKIRWLYCLFVSTGVLLTFSRSSIMVWALAVLSMAWARWFGFSRTASVMVTGSLMLIAGAGLTSGVWADYAIESGADKYLDTNALSRIASSFVSQEDESTKDRLRVAQRGISAFLNAPLLGQGIGALNTRALRTETHNQYIMVAAELGVVGLIVFLALLYLLWRNGTNISRMIALTYAFGCLFLHTLLVMPAMSLVFAIAISHTAKRRGELTNVDSQRLAFVSPIPLEHPKGKVA